MLNPINLSECEVYECLNDIDVKKADGPDGLPELFIKKMCQLFNISDNYL